MKKENIEIAKRIMSIEDRMKLGKNEKDAEIEIYNNIVSLSLEDLLEIDNYIMNKRKQNS